MFPDKHLRSQSLFPIFLWGGRMRPKFRAWGVQATVARSTMAAIGKARVCAAFAPKTGRAASSRSLFVPRGGVRCRNGTKSLKTLYSWGLAQIPCQTKENYLGNPV